MATNRIYKFKDAFELEYAKNCLYFWPFLDEDCMDTFSIIQSAWIYDDFKSFLKNHNIFANTEWDSCEKNVDDEYCDCQNEKRERGIRKIREKCLAAKIETWPFKKIVSSYIV